MKYYLKRLGHQELGSVKNGKAQRGRYIYISKDKNVLDIFPPLSKTVTNDSSIIPIIPLYQKIAKKIYCNYIYHNDKYNVSGGTRNEYRIYCNGALEGKQLLFQPDDILIFRAEKTSSLQKDILGSNDAPEAAVEEANVFFLYRCCDKNSELYRMCKKLVDESNIRGNGHAIYQGIITEVENKINQLCVKNFNEMDTVIEDTVVKGCEPENEELWKFCKVFILLLFDMDCAESVNRTLSASLIKCNSPENPIFVWSRLVEYAGQCNQAAASVSKESIDRHIFRGCGRAGDQSGHHASSNRVADRVHPAAWPWTSKSREQRICRCTGFHRKLPE